MQDGRRNKFKERKRDFSRNTYQICKDLCLNNFLKCQIHSISKEEQTMAHLSLHCDGLYKIITNILFTQLINLFINNKDEFFQVKTFNYQHGKNCNVK